VPTAVVRLADFDSRAEWDEAVVRAASVFAPDLVVLAGFMKILGAPFLERFGGVTVNTHPALLPAFPGAHGVRDALAHGGKVTGGRVGAGGLVRPEARAVGCGSGFAPPCDRATTRGSPRRPRPTVSRAPRGSARSGSSRRGTVRRTGRTRGAPRAASGRRPRRARARTRARGRCGGGRRPPPVRTGPRPRGRSRRGGGGRATRVPTPRGSPRQPRGCGRGRGRRRLRAAGRGRPRDAGSGPR